MAIERIGGNFFQSSPISDSQKTATEAVVSEQNNLRLGVKETRVVIDPNGNVLRLDANA